MRGVSDVGGLRDIPSMHTSGQRFMPWKEVSPYLRLHMLRVEQQRFEKEASLLARRSRRIQSRLAEISQQMELLEKSAHTGRQAGGGDGAVASGRRHNDWNTLRLDY